MVSFETCVACQQQPSNRYKAALDNASRLKYSYWTNWR